MDNMEPLWIFRTIRLSYTPMASVFVLPDHLNQIIISFSPIPKTTSQICTYIYEYSIDLDLDFVAWKDYLQWIKFLLVPCLYF